ncbi:MAG: response regulator [Ruminococcus sp.]|nr:response regulator [Ruminococcus sp.]
MNDHNEKKELQLLSHITLISTLVIFSTVLITLNVMLDWENWPILFLMFAMGCSMTMHILHRPDVRVRRLLYASFLMAEMFYYSVNVDTIYDITPVIVIMLMLFTATGIKAYAKVCFCVGIGGMVYHLLGSGNGAASYDISDVVRTVWHFLLVAIAGFTSVRMTDIREKTSSAYEDRIKKVEEENESATDFLANMSHEIRTPINAVIGLTNVMLGKERDEEIRQDMTAVGAAGHRIAEQISDILDYSEIDMKRLKNNIEPYMISSVLNDLVLQLRPLMSPGIELVIDVETSVPSVMVSDVSKIKKILWHLIGNGLKYTRTGGVYVRISSIPQSYGINLILEVSDTGIGIAEEDMERICDRFYQTNSGRTRSTSGLGLGLPIVSGFVRSLGGFMTIRSDKGKGTSVCVSLPQTVEDSTECMSVRDREKLCLGAFLHFEKYSVPQVREYYNSMIKHLVQGLRTYLHRVENIEDLRTLLENVSLTHLFVGEEEYSSDPVYIESLARKLTVVVVCSEDFVLPANSRAKLMHKPFYCFPVVSILNTDIKPEEMDSYRLYCHGVKALVVDDEPMNLMVARGILGRYGIEVFTADSGYESIDMCSENSYDIVFMDHMMPGMDGIEAMKHIRAKMHDSKQKIVALTANAASSAREMFMEEGFDGFVSKPIELSELERVLRAVLPKERISYEEITEDAYAGKDDSRLSAPAYEEEKETAPAPKDMRTLLAEGGIEMSVGLEYCQQDEEFYLQMLDQFRSESSDKRYRLSEFLDTGDLKNYAILVHALKSTAKMIGAEELSDMALGLEMASKEGRGDTVSAGHGPLLSLYGKTVSAIDAVIGRQSEESSADDEVMEFLPDDEVFEFYPEGGSEQ